MAVNLCANPNILDLSACNNDKSNSTSRHPRNSNFFPVLMFRIGLQKRFFSAPAKQWPSYQQTMTPKQFADRQHAIGAFIF
jgi:hypothetical protein